MSSPVQSIPTNELLDPVTVTNPKDPLPQVIGRVRLTTGWQHFMSDVSDILQALTLSGTTAQRPVSFLFTGRTYFDTTLGKPIWFKTAGWVDATGAGV